jgi:hypothetical protein
VKLVKLRLRYEQAWSLPDVYLFTANNVRTKAGKLVMGAGAAKAVRNAYPGIDLRIPVDALVTYAEVKPGSGQWIGRFQVKHHWKDAAELELIKRSSQLLSSHAKQRPNVQFHLNAPGVGNGQLLWADVDPLLQILPDNVSVYLC